MTMGPKPTVTMAEGTTGTTTATTTATTATTPKGQLAGGERPILKGLRRPELKSRLSVTSMNFGIPTDEDAQMHVHETHGPESWRYKVLRFLHTTKVQMTLMALLILDVLILCTELFLLAAYPECHTIRRDAISCCPVLEGDAAVDHSARLLAESGENGHSEEFCEAGLEPSPDYKAGCDEHKWEGVHTAEEVLFSLTMTILFVFFIELNFSMAALGPGIFFRQLFYLLDYFIVGTSIALELTFYLLSDDTVQSLVGLLVIGRIWRFVRIGHGLIEVTAELAHRKFVALLNYAEELEDLLRQNELDVPETEEIRQIKKESDEILTELRKEHWQHSHSQSGAEQPQDGENVEAVQPQEEETPIQSGGP
jgi:hypothetical protein